MMTKILSAMLVGLCVCVPSIVRADAVLDWNLTMTMAVGGQNPFAQGRFAAITQLAVFEAVNAIEGHYQGYLPAGTITTPSDASLDAAVASAAHAVLKNYLPAQGGDYRVRHEVSLQLLAAGDSDSRGRNRRKRPDRG